MTDRGPLPPKLYFRIGEVAHVVGVEPHVLRYWEREFRSIRPGKSAKGQRVYSRRDVESLLRIRELLYGQGFTIAGARRKMRDKEDVAGEAGELEEAAPATERDGQREAQRGSSVAPLAAQVAAQVTAAPTEPAPPLRAMSPHVRGELESLKAEIVTLLQELGGSP